VTDLEAEFARRTLSSDERSLNQAGITAAVAWRFIQERVPDRAVADEFPKLAAHSAAAERLPVFQSTPFE